MGTSREETESTPAGTEPRWKAAGEPYLLTRAELIDELATRDVRVTDRQLKRWATCGILPTPTRRAIPGDPGRHPYALHEVWIIGVVQEIVARLQAGRKLEDIEPIAPSIWRRWEMRRASFMPGYSGVFPSALGVPNIAYFKLMNSMQGLADDLEQRGFPLSHAKVTVFLKDGKSFTSTFDFTEAEKETHH